MKSFCGLEGGTLGKRCVAPKRNDKLKYINFFEIDYIFYSLSQKKSMF
jgi:hypothetical protein